MPKRYLCLTLIGATDGADNLIFGGADTLTAKLALSADMGPNNAGKATAASYRAMVKANGEYYAGTIYNVDLAAELTPTNTTELANIMQVLFIT